MAVTAEEKGLLGSEYYASSPLYPLATTVATSVTGYGFPFEHLLPSHKVGMLSLVILAVAIPARYVFHMAAHWRWIYVVGAVLALYFNVFVLVAQSFLKMSQISFALGLVTVIFLPKGIVGKIGVSVSGADGKRALAILESVEREYKTDARRVYLTGVSMGGEGVWSLAAAHPNRFAAIVPICGGGDPSKAADMARDPLPRVMSRFFIRLKRDFAAST
jgi:hypothetical protein